MGIRVATISIVLALTSAARAQTFEQQVDEVVLKDGTVLHGEITEMTRGEALTITLPHGARTIDWSEIDHVSVDELKPPITVPLQITRQATGHIHLVGETEGVTLEQLDVASGSWIAVCSNACDEDLALSNLYRLSGSGLRASHLFSIHPDHTTLAVTTASSSGFAGGLALTIIGGTAFLVGLTLVLEGLAMSGFEENADVFYAIAGVLGVVGIPTLIGGIVWMHSNARTKVEASAIGQVPFVRTASIPIFGFAF